MRACVIFPWLTYKTFEHICNLYAKHAHLKSKTKINSQKSVTNIELILILLFFHEFINQSNAIRFRSMSLLYKSKWNIYASAMIWLLSKILLKLWIRFIYLFLSINELLIQTVRRSVLFYVNHTNRCTKYFYIISSRKTKQIYYNFALCGGRCVVIYLMIYL